MTNLFECIVTLHKAGVYQSDLKPANVSFDRDPLNDEYVVKLIDFGMSSVDCKLLFGMTKLYFYNGRNRTEAAYQEGKITFETPLDRVKAELYGLSIIAV